MEYSTPAEFLGLFGVDLEKRGAADFCELVGRIVLLRCFPELRCTGYDAAIFEMRVRHNSPLVYWANMRRACAPVFESGREAVEALSGVSVAGEGDMTVYALAEAVARSLVPSAPRDAAQRSAAELLAAAIRQGGRKK